MKLHVYKNKDLLSHELALWISEFIYKTLEKQDYFSFVLSGGNTPKTLYTILASGDFKNKINWEKVHFFWGDERYVPFTDSRSNAKMAFDILLNNIKIPKENINIIPTDISPEDSAEQYEEAIKNYFKRTQNYFDLVLLGIGDDGHTLSLFPNSPLINEEKKWVNKVYNDVQEMFRITMMPTLVNNAKQIVFMVEGENKAVVLNKIIFGNLEPLKLPAQLISPVDGELHWFVDEDAASKIKKENTDAKFFGHVL